jgi:hypothetical protein
MNYLRKYATHATPRKIRPETKLSRYHIGPDKQANDPVMNSLLASAKRKRIQMGVRAAWSRNIDRIVDLTVSTIILASGLTYFYLCLIALT